VVRDKSGEEVDTKIIEMGLNSFDSVQTFSKKPLTMLFAYDILWMLLSLYAGMANVL